MSRYSEIGYVLLLMVGAVSVSYSLVDDPMESRRQELERDLARIAPEDVEYNPSNQKSCVQMLQRINSKPNLWNELVAAPKAAPAAPAAPNLKQQLAGVQVTRNELTRDGTVLVLIKTAENPRGEYLGVGGTVKGLRIVKITSTSVIFGLTKDGKEYSHLLQRK